MAVLEHRSAMRDEHPLDGQLEQRRERRAELGMRCASGVVISSISARACESSSL